jgi:hypothetical protein
MASTAAADLRRLIYGGSTRSGSLSTGDLEWFAANRGNVWLAAAAAAEAEATASAGIAAKQVGDLRIQYADDSAGYAAAADRLRAQGIRSVAPYAGGISLSDIDTVESDTDRPTPAFARGMMTNPDLDETST